MQKSPKLSKEQHSKHYFFVRDHCPAISLRGEEVNEFARVDAHHLRAVFPEQRRRSNPILVPLTREAHNFLHDNPNEEKELRPHLLGEALRLFIGENTALWEIAWRAVIASEADEFIDNSDWVPPVNSA